MEPQPSLVRLHSSLYRKLVMYLREKISPYGFSRGEFPFLVRLLKKGDGISQKEICQDVNISKSTTSKMINKLVEEGYLRMERDPEDKRVKRIYLTDKKEEIEDIVREIEQEVYEMMFKDFDHGERELYMHFLERIIDNIQGEME